MRTKAGLTLFALLLTPLPTAGQQEPPSVINIRVSRSVKTVTYRAKTDTKIDFVGTPLMPRAEGMRNDKQDCKSGGSAFQSSRRNHAVPRI